MPALDGLTSSEAKKQLEKFGPNKLPEKPPPSGFTILFNQIKSPLVYILLASGTVTVLLRDFSDAAMIFAAVVINTILGFIQEKRANDALHALKQMISSQAEVIRGGERMTIDVEDIVPGDIVFLNQGYKVPADGELVDINRLFMQEAILTGESAAVPKKKTDKVYMGTIVTGGRGYMKVTKTGEETEIGKIAESVQIEEEETPMKAQLRAFSKQLSIIVLVLTVVVFLAGILSGREITEVFTTSVALAVSAIPEGLLVGLTVVLAIGMQRILKQKGLVRNLVSAETLGGVTTICADKTGTLTQGEMRVVEHRGNLDGLVTEAILSNDLDDPVVLAAYDWGVKNYKKDVQKLLEEYPRFDGIPFTSELRFSASLHKRSEEENILFAMGAPEYLLESTTLGESEKKKVRQEIDELTTQGMRLLGLVSKKVHKEKKTLRKEDVKSGMEWVGILALSDPVREGAKSALNKTKRAGIDTIVITGDYAQTARAVMDQLGFEVKDKEIILGVDLQKMSEAQLAARLKQKSVKLFARTSPDQKLKIVNALKQNGEVVAMMGDGVNDAPALAKADIGIVVGEATDVAKESADLVLLDSSFNTIISAIEEGRGIFNNVRKIVLYLMCDAFGAIVAVVASIVFGLPITVTAAQILWINLISDGFPNLALTVDPKQKGIMKLAPRSPQEPLINKPMKFLIGMISLLVGIMVFGLFAYWYRETGLEVARSVAFASLGVNTLIYVFSIRTLDQPAWSQSPFSNKWLLGAVVLGFSLQFLPYLSSRLGAFLEIVPIPLTSWALVFAIAFLMFSIIEISKRTFLHKFSHQG